MAIYFNPEKSTNLEAMMNDAKIPGHQKIGTAFTKALDLLKDTTTNSKEIVSLLRYLGVSPNDPLAIKTMSEMLPQLADDSLQIIETDSSGAFFIQKGIALNESDNTELRNIAVFKIGRKRASMETMVRHLANSLGLEKHMLPGIFCALQNPPLSNEEEEAAVEELWNGLDKTYLPDDNKDPAPLLKFGKLNFEDEIDLDAFGKESENLDNVKKTARTVVGIVQPFLPDQSESSLYEYTLMTILALAIGLRDGKQDGYKGSMFFDVEDCMPLRIDPVWSKENMHESPSAIDLPYLDKDERTHTMLSQEDVGRLAELVQKWNITAIVQDLNHLKIRYEDKTAELFEEEKRGLDEGGCNVEVAAGIPHQINGVFNHLDKANSKKRHILHPDQLEACNTRLRRIQDFIKGHALQQTSFSPQDLVCAVDKFGKVFREALLSSPSSSLPKSVSHVLNSQGPNHITGRQSPKVLRQQLPLLHC